MESRKKDRFRGRQAYFLEGGHGLGRDFSAILFRLQLGSPTPRPAFEDLAVMQDAIGGTVKTSSKLFHCADVVAYVFSE